MISPFKNPRPGSNTRFKPSKTLFPPVLPETPYMRFNKTNLEKLKQHYPNTNIWNLGRIMGQLWREMPDSDKTCYYQSYNAEKAVYDRSVKDFYNNYSVTRNNDSEKIYKPEEEFCKKNAALNEYSLLFESEESYIDPAMDKSVIECSDFWYDDQVRAHSRYVKNNYLMNVIFSRMKLSQQDTDLTRLNYKIIELKKSSHFLETYLNKEKFNLQLKTDKHKHLMNKLHSANMLFEQKVKDIKDRSNILGENPLKQN